MTKTILSTLIALSTLLLVLPAQSQDAGTAALAYAIYRVKTGESGRLAWRECGTRLHDEEAMARAEEYAALFVAEHTADSSFDPWVGASIAMTESSFNRCAVSRGARTSLEEYLGRDATEADILRLLRDRSFRSRAGVEVFDAGLVQFRWPGAVATLVGVTDAGTLVDAPTSIHMLAASMQHYHEACSRISAYTGTHTVNNRDGTIRVVRYSIPCEEGYWVQHNSPRTFNYRYYRSVMRWHDEMRRLSTEVPTPEEGSAS